MNDEKDQLWDVVICEKATQQIDAFIGRSMRRWDGIGTGKNSAESRARIGLERVNSDYTCKIVPAGQYKAGDFLDELESQ